MPYSPTVWVNGTTPAINATNLNKLKNELASQAAAKSIAHTLQNWVNGTVPAVSDQTNLDEMERVARAVSLTLPITAYVVTDWSNGWVPARNAANLNKLEIAARDNRAAIDAAGAVPSIPTGLVATPGNAQVQLNWNANPAGQNVDYYQAFEGGELIDNHVVGTSKLATTDHLGNPLVNGASYGFQINAHNAAGYSPWNTPPVTATPTGPAPSNRYLDVNFAADLYWGEGITECLESPSVDARIASSGWGGREAYIYDNPGAYGLSPATSMTTDQNQRVHLFSPTSVGLPANPNGGNYASWQELRTTDGPWYTAPDNSYRLAKASLNGGTPETWGPGGWSFGIERWFAFDILFPLNILGASAEFSNSWHTLGDIHVAASSGDSGDPALCRFYPNGNGHPKYLTFSSTYNVNSVAYINGYGAQVTNADGSRVVANHNVWHEMVFGIKTAYDGVDGSSSGWVEAWCNGVQILPRRARPQFNSTEGGPYLQLQNYMDYDVGFVSGATRGVIVYGGLRAGLSRSDVQKR